MTTDGWFILLLVFIAAMLCATATTLLILGWRGRRTDDHPLCRRCSYDLSGMPDITGTLARCAECGAGLTARRAVTIGHRRPRWLPLASGGFLFVVLLAGGTAAAVSVTRGVDWTAHKPLWWLLRDAESSDPAVRESAQNLIFERQFFPRWPPDQMRAILDRALDRHADRSRPWDDFWSRTLAYELSADRVPFDQWQRYVRQALPTVSLRARARVERGKPLPFEFLSTGGRFDGEMSGLELRGRPEDRTVWIDGIAISPAGSELTLDSSDGVTSWPKKGLDLGPLLDCLADGPHTLRIRQRFIAVGGSGAGLSRVGKSRWKASGEQVEDHTVPFELLPAGQSSVTRHTDAATEAAVRKALTAHRVWMYPGRFQMRGGSLDVEPAKLEVGFDKSDSVAPMAVALKIAVRHSGREWHLPDLRWLPGEGPPRGSYKGSAVGFPTGVKKVDVVFRSDAESLAETVDVLDTWEGTIVQRNVWVADRRTAATWPKN